MNIQIWKEEHALTSESYHACWGEYDFGKPVGSGPTPEDAVRDLINNYDSPTWPVP